MINPAGAQSSFNQLDQLLRIEELYLLQRVAQKINSILDLETLLDEVVGDVADTFGYSRLAVLLKDEQTLELVIGAGWTGELCLKGTRFKIGQDGMSGQAAATRKMYYAPDVRKNPYYIKGEEDTRSEIDIPLIVRDELIGIFNVQHTSVNAFSPERIRLLESLAGHISTAIANARMFERERRENDRMTRELDEARAVQFGLFPAENPKVDGFEITGVCVPCREVGGDWYDYIPLGDGRLAVVLADVSGKGMGAALLMSSARSVLRMYATSGFSPGEVLKKVNDVLLSDFPSAKFVTLVLAVIDPGSRKITFANAGHLYPLLVDGNGAEFLETASGLPLGIMESEFAEREIELDPGSRLFLYTDGVTEAQDVSGQEFGTKRLRDYAANGSGSSTEFLDRVNTFADGTAVNDDMTAVTITAI
jgi:sigma-B regulation protein RsbU (phosphoserine phosphatase)